MQLQKVENEGKVIVDLHAVQGPKIATLMASVLRDGLSGSGRFMHPGCAFQHIFMVNIKRRQSYFHNIFLNKKERKKEAKGSIA